MQKTKSTGIHTDWKKNIALFLIGQALSLMGTMVVQYAITWHVTLTTKSGIKPVRLKMTLHFFSSQRGYRQILSLA